MHTDSIISSSFFIPTIFHLKSQHIYKQTLFPFSVFPMAELLIEAFVTVLFDKLASGDLIRLARSAKIESKLEKLRNNLALIRAVLVDAGQKHISDKSVQLWLNQLHHLAYELDDVLDDLATEAMRRQLNQESSATTSKVLNFIPTKVHDVKYAHKMSSKIDEVTTKLRDLVEQKNLLGLNQNVERSSRTSKRLEETSLVVESKIIGRGGDKEELLRTLLGSESSSSPTQNFRVVSIVGLGGIGKTTLAQLLYNDKKVKAHFELMSWVCVSEEFDVFTISKAIFKDVGGKDIKFETLNKLQEALVEKLSKKRFLLVLDDVWNEKYNDWELLQRPFYAGAPGSIILVTTRKIMVSSVMNSAQTYPLELLSDNEALSLFAQHALGKPNFDSRPTIKLHGEAIMKKCGGLPLALRTLGWVLRTKSNDEEWEELLNSELWNSQNGSEILPALRLSYYDLPQHLKQMFVYCCLFPKDYMFNKEELVLLWMAEGFLGQTNGEKSMESFGEECFEELVSRSFIQHSSNEKSLFTMHDLINDLATSIAGEAFFRLDDKIDVYNKQEATEKVHHLSFIRQPKEFKALHRARRLRTLLAISDNWEEFFISKRTLIELLPQLKFLRTLSLTECEITEVPQSIGRLKHMRYLNFSITGISCLPEQVGDLVNLQSLLLSNCDELSSLPNSIGKLINLRHLDINNTPSLDKMPLGLGGLTCLQTLSRVIIGGPGECRISDLKGMLHLRGQLSIEGLHKVKDVVHAKEVNLHKKKGIYDLKMKWSDIFDDSRDGKTEYDVLEGLRPSEKLRSLKIVNYMGTKYPSWVGDSSFVFLTHLTLRGCRSTCLPTLGHLPLLQELYVERMDGLKTLGLELLRPSNSWHGVAFPSLEVLEFENMKSWEEWSISGCDIAGAFPCLHQMSIINCPKLESYNGPKSIEKFEIRKCESLVSLRCWKEEHLKIGTESNTQVIIDDCVKLGSYYCQDNIKVLKIEGCPSLTSFTFPTMDNLPSTLRSIKISSCDDMEVSWLLNNFLSSLESLYFYRIPNLRLFPEGCLLHLTNLTIEGCDNIESIPDNGYGFLPFLCLRELNIYNCKNLKSFPHEQLQNLTSPEQMEICDCPSLDFPFPCGVWPPNLSSLRIGGLKKPVSEWGMQNFPTSLVTLELYGNNNSEGLVSFSAKAEEEEEEDISSFILPSSLTKLHIWGFKELESVSEGLQHLTCLQHLGIFNCPKLRDLPETLLPSLSTLTVILCSPELEEKCSESREGKYWPLISQIPHLNVPPS